MAQFLLELLSLVLLQLYQKVLKPRRVLNSSIKKLKRWNLKLVVQNLAQVILEIKHKHFRVSLVVLKMKKLQFNLKLQYIKNNTKSCRLKLKIMKKVSNGIEVL